jgi:adenylate kinase
MRQPILFVGGVHGSGKTTICRLIAEAYPAVHVTAGALICEAADASHIVTVGAQDKAVPDVDANQAVVAEGA